MRMQPAPDEARHGGSGWAALGPACLGYFFVLLDVTILNVSLADTLAVAGAILLVGGGIGLGVIRDG
jgi:hypothetical protein